jgi:hypothetical protein
MSARQDGVVGHHTNALHEATPEVIGQKPVLSTVEGSAEVIVAKRLL